LNKILSEYVIRSKVIEKIREAGKPEIPVSSQSPLKLYMRLRSYKELGLIHFMATWS
jgi:hypothetical protein